MKYQWDKRPLIGVSEPDCSVNRQRKLPGRCAGLYGELRAAASSKESLGPSKQEGEKILLSGLLDGFFMLAADLNRRKE